MNIVYATRATIPYASAASLNTVQMCQSLVELGHQVTLAVGRKFWRRNSGQRDWSSYYGFAPRFNVARFCELPRISWGFDGAVLRAALRSDALLYLRYPRLLAHRLAGRVASLLEVHSALPAAEQRLVAAALGAGSLRGVVVISDILRQHLLSSVELRPFADRLLVAPDAVSCERFSRVPAGLDLSQLGYVGSLYPGKGMERIAEIAGLRPDLTVHVIGGRTMELRYWRHELADLKQLKLWGPVAPSQVPDWMGRFGIALLPNQPVVRLPNGDDIGRFTSPMKLFEYMAAGRAIVASDLPGLREVLRHEVNCLLVDHRDPRAWIAAIERLRAEPELVARLAARARHEAGELYSYRRRFQTILGRFLPGLPQPAQS